MRIGDLARKSKVGVETVRFYEQKGLIARPLRPKSGGYRDYPPEVICRISFIRSAQHLGFSLSEISDLLKLKADDTTQCGDVRRRAEIKRVEVRNKIDNLNRIKKALDILIKACPGEGPAQNCSILEAINTGDLHLRPITKGATDE